MRHAVNTGQAHLQSAGYSNASLLHFSKEPLFLSSVCVDYDVSGFQGLSIERMCILFII